MRQYLPLFLIMGLLAIASVSSTEYLYAKGIWGNGYIDDLFDKDVTYFKVYKTEEFEVVKFSVKRFTRCHEIDIINFDLGALIKIMIDDGPHKGESGWINFDNFFMGNPPE